MCGAAHNLFETRHRGSPSTLLLPKEWNCDAWIWGRSAGAAVRADAGEDTVFDGDDLSRSDPNSASPVRTISGRRASSIGAHNVSESAYSPGDPLDARPGHHHGTVGSPSSRTVTTSRRGSRVGHWMPRPRPRSTGSCARPSPIQSALNSWRRQHERRSVNPPGAVSFRRTRAPSKSPSARPPAAVDCPLSRFRLS